VSTDTDQVVDDQQEAAPAKLITLLVPAYNEALKIMASLTEMYGYMCGLSERYRFELLVIDDGSTDETADIVEAFARTRPEVRLVRQPVNMRLGQALRDGFAESAGDIIVVFDSDLSYSVEHIGRLLDVIETERVAIAIASPYMKGGQTTDIPWNRAVMSKQVNKVLSAASQYDIHTMTGMVRAYDGLFIRSLSLKSMGPEINTEILYKAQVMRARVAEIPAHLDWSDQAQRMAERRVSLRVTTTSKLLVFASFLYRPILFFIVPGLVLLAISMWSGGSLLWTVIHEADTHSGGWDRRFTQGFADAWKLRPQTFIIAGFTFVVAVQLISLGLLAAQAKRYFEELFYATMRRRRDDRRLIEVVGAVEAAAASQQSTAD
jgi:glycosyltransferase involved in cell wall biosynthesis